MRILVCNGHTMPLARIARDLGQRGQAVALMYVNVCKCALGGGWHKIRVPITLHELNSAIIEWSSNGIPQGFENP